jgi:hypothetical protein
VELLLLLTLLEPPGGRRRSGGNDEPAFIFLLFELAAAAVFLFVDACCIGSKVLLLSTALAVFNVRLSSTSLVWVRYCVGRIAASLIFFRSRVTRSFKNVSNVAPCPNDISSDKIVDTKLSDFF